MLTISTTPRAGSPILQSPPSARRPVAGIAARDFTPFATALIPFSLAIGSSAAINGLTLSEGLFGAVALLAGSAQLAAIELIGSNTGAGVVVLTMLLINARFMIYGAGLARWFSEAPLRLKMLLALPLVDQTFLCCEERFATMTDQDERRRYYLTGSAILIVVFLASQTAGYMVGPVVPEWLGLHLAAPLAFAGMLIKACKTRQHVVVAGVAAVVAVGCVALPGGLAFPLAIVGGVVVGSRITGETS